MNEITTLISNVGFPIVACFMMFNQNNKLSDTLTEFGKTLTSVVDTLKSMDARLAQLEGGNQNGQK